MQFLLPADDTHASCYLGPEFVHKVTHPQFEYCLTRIIFIGFSSFKCTLYCCSGIEELKLHIIKGADE